MERKILIKAKYIVPSFRNGSIGGYGRALQGLLSEMEKMRDNNLTIEVYYLTLWSLFYNPKLLIKSYSIPLPNFIQKILGEKFESFIRRKIIGYDLLHIPVNYDYVRDDENFVMTIHDLIEYKNLPSTRKYFELCSKRVNRIITCSEYSKQDIVQNLGISADKIDVVYWGIDHKLFHKYSNEDVNITLNKYGITSKYFFSCSCKGKRKNCDITLEAFKLLASSDEVITLVFAWNNFPQNLREKYDNLIRKGRIVILNSVSDEELAHLYSGAIATYFISSCEGFGFPVLESFACGTPCVTCKNSSLTEIGSDKAVYVKERDVEDTLVSMKGILNGDIHINETVLMDYAKKFTWKVAAEGYITAYKKALGFH